MSRAVIVYHDIDFDGYFACLLMVKYAKDVLSCSETIAVGYRHQKDFNLDLKKDDVLIFADCFHVTDDYSFYKNINEMCSKIYVVDHHVTTKNFIESEQKIFREGFNDAVKWNLNVTTTIHCRKVSAAAIAYELCTRYFSLREDIGVIIDFISEYDIFGKNVSKNEWNDVILPFQYGLRSKSEKLGIDFKNPLDSSSFMWEHVSNNDIFVTKPINVKKIIKAGKNILSFIKNRNLKVFEDSGKENAVVVLKSKNEELVYTNCSIVFDYRNNSLIFEDNLGKEYVNKTLCFLVNVNHYTKKYTTTIISPSWEKKNVFEQPISAGKLCSLFGGGGHDEIGGCVFDSFEVNEKGECVFTKN